MSHFSAGIGRTGTSIAIDYLLRQAKAESHIDVFRTVTDMRYQRTNFVQTDVSNVRKRAKTRNRYNQAPHLTLIPMGK